jgi:3-hydroxyacyl-CoA dehydrogenase
MSLKIRNVAVLGSGVMGAQIASLLGAVGCRVYVFDVPTLVGASDVPGSLEYRLKRSEKAVKGLKSLESLKPNPIYSQRHMEYLEPCNFEDDLDKLKQCDWIIEAVVENLDIKKKLFKEIAAYLKTDVWLTTNTSGIFLHKIAEAIPQRLHSRFFGTHFFNPPRYMKLLEMIPFAATDRQALQNFATWAEETLGKGVVFGCDTINFIANRIGTFCSHAAMHAMCELNLNIETVDELTGPLIGRSKSATFRTADIVGLDTGVAVAMNNYKHDPQDPYREWFVPPKWMSKLVESGRLGQKTGGLGIYKKTKDTDGTTKILVYRPESGEYSEPHVMGFNWIKEARAEKNLAKRLKMILKENDVGTEFIRRHLRDMFAYSSLFVGSIADGEIKAVDDALKWGFNWEMGPFELWQSLGFDEFFERMKKDHVPMGRWLKPGLRFYEWNDQGQPTAVLRVKDALKSDVTMIAIHPRNFELRLPKNDLVKDVRTIFRNPSAQLIDIGDGVAALVFHSKMNTVNPQITDMIEKSLDKVAQDFYGMVIANDAPNFSAGADIRDFMSAIHGKKYEYIDTMEKAFHGTMCRLKFASFPIVSCPTGLTLGGGCEVSLHTSRQILGAETFAGLVEAGVGLLPAGGGTKELALRAYERAMDTEDGDPMPFLWKSLWLIAHARRSASGFDALEMGLYSPLKAQVYLSREHLTQKAKTLVLNLEAQGFMPAVPRRSIKVVGNRGIALMEAKLDTLVSERKISEYDRFIASRVARILCGGEVPEGTLRAEQDLLDLERIYFVELCQQPKTLERIEYMLKNGQPLKN